MPYDGGGDVSIIPVAPVADIPIVHELTGGIELEREAVVEWAGTHGGAEPMTILHEVGDAAPTRMRAALDVPPWCTFHVDHRGEPAAVFHGVFGEVDRLLTTVVPGSAYRVRYASPPSHPVVALQSELTAFSFALVARELGLIAHACAFTTSAGEGVLCPGVSGTGKTTLARLLSATDASMDVLTDDRAIVTLDRPGARVWGSPWPGAAKLAGTGSAHLTTVVFIRHGESPRCRPVTAADAFRRLLNTLSVPLWEPGRCAGALAVVDAIVSHARLIELTFPPTTDGARWVLNEVMAVAPVGAA